MILYVVVLLPKMPLLKWYDDAKNEENSNYAETGKSHEINRPLKHDASVLETRSKITKFSTDDLVSFKTKFDHDEGFIFKGTNI